jgi:hypothetical protein
MFWSLTELARPMLLKQNDIRNDSLLSLLSQRCGLVPEKKIGSENLHLFFALLYNKQQQPTFIVCSFCSHGLSVVAHPSPLLIVIVKLTRYHSVPGRRIGHDKIKAKRVGKK